MALYGRANVVHCVRTMGKPFWKIYETKADKDAGNTIYSAPTANKDLGLEESCQYLLTAVNALGGGRYILTAYDTPDGKRGGVSSNFELESLGGLAGIGSPGIGSAGTPNETYVEGIGMVGPHNIGEAIEKKMSQMFEEERKKKQLEDLQKKIAELEAEKKEGDGLVNKGLMTIGSVLHGQFSQSPAYKDFVGMVAGIMTGKQEAAPKPPATSNAIGAVEHVDGDLCEIGGTCVDQHKLFSALDGLGKDNPDVLEHLQMLEGIKKNNPDMYQQLVQMGEAFK